MVKITGLDKAEVLAALYNNAKPMGLSVAEYNPYHTMLIPEAHHILKTTTNFDYLGGRVLKVDLSNDDEFDEWLYDRDNGTGAAQRAIDSIEREDSTMIETTQLPTAPEEQTPPQDAECPQTPEDKPTDK